MRFDLPNVSVEVVKAHRCNLHSVVRTSDRKGTFRLGKVAVRSGRARRLYCRILLADRWFERTVAGRILGGFVFALLSFELFFLFGIFQ